MSLKRREVFLMERRLYKSNFQKNIIPNWRCPTCDSGNLKIKKDTFAFEETSDSKKTPRGDDWWPGEIEYVYSCLFQCMSCNEVIASSGVGFMSNDSDEPDMGWTNYFKPKYFQPHLKIFSYPKKTPTEVSEALERSFELFFCNAPSALNHVRVGLEFLLTYLKVKRYEINKGKKIRLTLHRRIELIPAGKKELKDLFLAIKWLGNAGSHGDNEVTKDNVMDAYDIMDNILRELFENKKKHVDKIARKIIKRKGP